MTESKYSDDASRETTDQLVMQDPTTRYPEITPPIQDQPEPGLDAQLIPKTDRGQFSYRGTGRLEGRKALITGGDSGIGAAVAIAFAREGADVALNYLPVEEEDAQWVKSVVERDGRACALIPGDLGDAAFCAALPDEAAAALGGLDILVNNAGRQIAVGGLEEITDEQVAETFDVNTDLDGPPGQRRPTEGEAAGVREEHRPGARRSTHRARTGLCVPGLPGIQLRAGRNTQRQRGQAHSVR